MQRIFKARLTTICTGCRELLWVSEAGILRARRQGRTRMDGRDGARAYIHCRWQDGAH